MKGENHGIPFNRCNLCTVDATDDSYCKKCKQKCYDRCSQEVTNIGMEFDLDLTYRQMAKVLSDRGY
jgi:hypothetical protein